MAAKELKSKLAAILSADVKGYSRLMGEDEEWTLRTLDAYKEVMASLIQQHRGRVVGTERDRVLAEFASVVDAVQCAVETQQVLRANNWAERYDRDLKDIFTLQDEITIKVITALQVELTAGEMVGLYPIAEGVVKLRSHECLSRFSEIALFYLRRRAESKRILP
jgi:hypothetical protein